MSGEAQSAAAFCASLVRNGDFERYAASLFVAPELRRSLLALYAFNLEIARVREQVTQALAGEIRLQWWSDLLAGTAHGEAAANPVAAELVQAIERHALPQAPLVQMIDAHRADLYEEPLRNTAELEAYLLGTASALFDLSARVLGDGAPHPDITRHAGLAFGLVRIVEAMPRHASRGRIFLPLDELDQAGIVRNDLFIGKTSPQLQRFLQTFAEKAREHLKIALHRIAVTDTPARKAFLPLALLDRRLKSLTSAFYQPFAAQPAPSNLSVLWTLWRAARRVPFRD